MFAKLFQWLKPQPVKSQNLAKQKLTPTIIPRSAHTFSRRMISPHALKVLYRLHDAGFQAYLVGGGVRDGLLDRHPKDFDIATNAHPEEVFDLFRNSRMIGRRFRLVHVHFGNHIVEVATFRAGLEDIEGQHDLDILQHAADGRILRDNIYGSLEQDVWRRDFTVNALYYNIADFSIMDCVGGLKDLKNKILRLIGNPEQRYREDPVRMLRAIRFAAKLDFKIHPDTETPIYPLAELITNVPSARIFDEYLKLFLNGFAWPSYELLEKYGIFKILFPETHASLGQASSPWMKRCIEISLKNTDDRVAQDKTVTPIFLLAVFLWYPLATRMEYFITQHQAPLFQALHEAALDIVQAQQNAFSIPRRMIQLIREIWILQIRMQLRAKNKIRYIETHPRFRAAFDFLMLRKQAGEPIEMIADWWHTYEHSGQQDRQALINSLSDKKRPKRHRKKRSSPKKDSVSTHNEPNK